MASSLLTHFVLREQKTRVSRELRGCFAPRYGAMRLPRHPFFPPSPPQRANPCLPAPPVPVTGDRRHRPGKREEGAAAAARAASAACAFPAVPGLSGSGSRDPGVGERPPGAGEAAVALPGWLGTPAPASSSALLLSSALSPPPLSSLFPEILQPHLSHEKKNKSKNKQDFFPPSSSFTLQLSEIELKTSNFVSP